MGVRKYHAAVCLVVSHAHIFCCRFRGGDGLLFFLCLLNFFYEESI